MSSEFKLPFDTYDFFGYLLPGTLLSLGLSFIFWDKIGDDVLKFIPGFGEKVEVDATVAILFVFVAIMTLYFLGHVVGCIAHIIYDRVIVRNILGYPFYRILKLEKMLSKELSEATRIRWFLLIIAGVSSILMPLLLYWDVDRRWIIFIWGGLFLFYVVLFLLFLLNKDFLKTRPAIIIIEFCRIMHLIFRMISVTNIGVNETLCNKFFERLEKTTTLTKEKIVDYNSDVYWLAYMDLIQQEDGSHHEGKISNWLCLYGCLRNYSCAFLIISIFASVRLWLFPDVICVCLWDDFERLAITVVVALLLCFLLFMRYWIFYYAYYSKYIIRAYAVGEYSKKNTDTATETPTAE